MTIRVLICDDHEMVREALAAVLNNEDDLSVVRTTNSVTSTIKSLEESSDDIDVAVLDVRLGDGTGHNITQWIKSHCPTINVVLLTSFLEDQVLVDGYSSKASAIVLKGAPTQQLVDAIRDVAAGMQLINPVEVRAASKRVNSIPSNVLSSLSETDREIALLISQGLTDKDIAAAVHFSVQTVKNRVSKILTQVGAANRTQLAVFVATAHDMNDSQP
jgi:two-component system, NarL family, response regulator DevR